ncbi:MAG: hypothetical protein GWN79_12220, partial [Actinobacteria bacterium]|nr:hypothetical protein [Gemmatimonadota bacterium]NIU19807.1 hypothetical protein [Actinomycetota bacterium]NIV56499.1 hypothetical protein [Actinomycetota bacterium]NIW37568.1 hypothetical protein [Gemmatimonadota bacterium]NIX45247.1 hypothetical protein [Gemmatimonadota bacterium]
MDLFELLIIAAFVLIPILEGVMKQRRKSSEGPIPGEDKAPTGPDRAEEPRPAADMLPDDLWQILTGERRTSPEPEPNDAPWSLEPMGSEEQPGPEPIGVDTADDWGPEPWRVEGE